MVSAFSCSSISFELPIRVGSRFFPIDKEKNLWHTVEVGRLTSIMETAITYTIEAIRKLIEDELNPGERLPSEKELVDQLGVSRSTVRDALARLATEGVLEKRWGVGTFVSERRPPTAFGILSIRPGVPGLLASTGGKASVYRFSYTETPPDQDLFPDFPDVPTYSVVRVFALDGVPAVVIRDRMVRRFAGGEIDPSKLQSLDVLVADIFDDVGVNFAGLEVTLWSANMDKEGRLIFDLQKTEPVIETRGYGLDPEGRRILSARGTYRTRVVELSLKVS